MPWATWTTRSPSARSRKLSMARDSSRRRVQLVAHPGHVAAEALDRLDAQVATGLDRGAGQGRHLHAREADQLPENALHREQSLRVADPLEVVPALFVQLLRFHQDRPGA